MPTVEVEIGDDGNPVKVPGEVQKLIDKAFGQGQAKATDEAKGKLAAEIEKLKKGGALDPAERERLRTLEADHSKLTEELAIRDKKFDEAQRIRDERHKRDLDEINGKLTASQQEIEKRTKRIEELGKKEIRAAALTAGARKESLDELEQLLGSRIGLDDGLQPFVRDDKDPGKPLLDKDQKPVSIEGFVAQYLADRPHHKAPAPGRGGGAPGGRSMTGASKTDSAKAEAVDEVARNPGVHTVARALANAGKGT